VLIGDKKIIQPVAGLKKQMNFHVAALLFTGPVFRIAAATPLWAGHRCRLAIDRNMNGHREIHGKERTEYRKTDCARTECTIKTLNSLQKFAAEFA